MKNFSLLLLLITTSIFTSCKKDPDKKNAANIVGKWYLQNSHEKEYKNGALTREDNTPISNDSYFDFRSNGTVVDTKGEEYTYKIADSKLTVRSKNDPDDEWVQDIKKINSNEMVLYGEESDTEGKDTYKYTWEDTYKKK